MVLWFSRLLRIYIRQWDKTYVRASSWQTWTPWSFHQIRELPKTRVRHWASMWFHRFYQMTYVTLYPRHLSVLLHKKAHWIRPATLAVLVGLEMTEFRAKASIFCVRMYPTDNLSAIKPINVKSRYIFAFATMVEISVLNRRGWRCVNKLLLARRRSS